jgi:hypothetical protein
MCEVHGCSVTECERVVHSDFSSNVFRIIMCESRNKIKAVRRCGELWRVQGMDARQIIYTTYYYSSKEEYQILPPPICTYLLIIYFFIDYLFTLTSNVALCAPLFISSDDFLNNLKRCRSYARYVTQNIWHKYTYSRTHNTRARARAHKRTHIYTRTRTRTRTLNTSNMDTNCIKF